MAKERKIIKDIRAYLSSKKTVETKRNQDELRCQRFVKPLVDLFNTKEVQALLKRTQAKVSLFSHYSSSMGAAMTNSPPDYEIVVSSEGLQEKRNGRVDKTIPWPATVTTWSKVIPYDGLFHDSSSGDYRFKPRVASYIKVVEDKLRKLIRP